MSLVIGRGAGRSSARALGRIETAARRRASSVAVLVGALGLGACNDSDGGDGGDAELMTAIRHWNQIAVDASGLDHAPANVGPAHVQGQNLGPGRSSRAMAIVHVAVFEAINAVEGGYQSYVGLPATTAKTSVHAAIAQASHDTLAELYPSQAAHFAADLADDLAHVRDGAAKTNGIALGAAAADAILAMRTNDGSQLPEPVYGVDFIPVAMPGHWSQDPVSLVPLALGADWDQVTPFLLTSADQFRVPAPPAVDSAAYALAFNEELVFGGDGVTTPHGRSDQQTETGIFWAYDGTPTLCAPPRLYNQVLMTIADQQKLGPIEVARLLAIANVAMADTGIAAWESKYFYDYWRPITAIRDADNDNNPATISDAAFMPLGAPVSNALGPNFTPPFPAYPSGHAAFGGALFQTLRRFLGTDDVTFTFVSDELNGVTLDNTGTPRPLLPRTFTSLSEAEEENGQSRIYLGIHWRFDKTEGILQGNAVADWVFDRLFVPVP